MKRSALLILAVLLLNAGAALAADGPAPQGRIVYLVSDLQIPFWSILSRGVRSAAAERGYTVDVYSADNSARQELVGAGKAIADGVRGIILSPTNSSASVTILKLAKRAGIPVVIADIGTDGGEYVSYIASDNRTGAYQLGQMLADEMQRRGWQEGSVGIVAIPQKRANGQARTAGFMQALKAAGIHGADIRQQITFSYQETYDHSRAMLAKYPDLRALWLQGSDRYQAALDAIADAGRQGEVLLICFDAEPEFVELIRDGVLVGAAMQQPFLMGEKAVAALDRHLRGEKVKKSIQLPILAVSRESIARQLPTIRRNVLGLEAE